MAWFLNGGSRVMRVNRPTSGDLRGASLQTPRAGRLWFWRTCGTNRISTGLDVARRRGPWVRAPLFAHPCVNLRASGTPGVPRALGTLSGRAAVCCRIPGKPGIRSPQTTAHPAPAKEYGRRSYVLVRVFGARRSHLCPACNTFRTFKPYPSMTLSPPRFGHTLQRHRGPPSRVIA